MEHGTNAAREWLRIVSNGAPEAEIARNIGVTQRTFARHATTGALTPNEVVAVARFYGANPVYALRDNGVITDEEIESVAAEVAGEQIPLRTLLEIALRKIDTISSVTSVVAQDLESGKADLRVDATMLSEAVSELLAGDVAEEEPTPLAPVTRLPLREDIEVTDELLARSAASIRPGDVEDDTPPLD